MIFLAGVVCLLLVGPLRGTLSAVPLLIFLATLVLFMLPGVVLSRLVSDSLPGVVSRVPVAFAFSTGVYGLVAVAAIALGRGLDGYLMICGGLLIASLILAVAGVAPRREPPRLPDQPEARSFADRLLWVPFLALTGVLAYASSLAVPEPLADMWVYLAHLQSILETNDPTVGGGELGRLSGMVGNWWWLEQAALSLVSGLDPAELLVRFLGPTLVVVTLLSIFALAHTLLRDERTALVIGSLSALLFLAGLGARLRSPLADGEQLITRVTEGKLVVLFVFLPVALLLAVAFVRGGGTRLLGSFFFVCLTTTIVHPIGTIFVGTALAGLGILHLAIGRKERAAWRRIGALWSPFVVAGGLLAAYLLVTGSGVPSSKATSEKLAFASLLEEQQREGLLLALENGGYIVPPSFLLDPVALPIYLPGVLFLAWKAKESLAARLLLGTQLFVPILVFLPPLSTTISEALGPWVLHRLTWPLIPAAPLTLGWMAWEALRWTGTRLGRRGLGRYVAPTLSPVLVVVGLLAGIVLAPTAVRATDTSDEVAQGEVSCMDPAFRWMRDALPDGSTVLTPGVEGRVGGSCVRAYSPSADTLVRRTTIRAEKVQLMAAFYGGPPVVDEEALQVLERNEVDYVLLPAGSPLNAQLRHLPGFGATDAPSERYRVYRVDREELRDIPEALLSGNTYSTQKLRDQAMLAYTEALRQGGEDERFLAHLGLGRVLVQEGRLDEGTASYEEATRLDPEDPEAHAALGEAYLLAARPEEARTAMERSIEIEPRNVELRRRFAKLLLSAEDPEGAVEQHRQIVALYPDVPKYRVALGNLYRDLGRPEEARAAYERALKSDPEYENAKKGLRELDARS